MTPADKKQKQFDIGDLRPKQPPQKELSAVQIMVKSSGVAAGSVAPDAGSPAPMVLPTLEAPQAESVPELGTTQAADQLAELWASHSVRNFGLFVDHATAEAQPEKVEQPEQLEEPQPAVPQQRRLVPQLAMFAIVALIVAGSVQGAKIFASTLQARSVVLGSTTDAIAHLKSAQSLISQSDVAGSQQQLLLAQQGFAQAQQNLDSFGGLLNGVLMASAQGHSASSLLDAGQSIAAAGQQLESFYVLTSQLNVNAGGVSVQGDFSGTLGKATGYLDAAHADVERASADVQQVDVSSLPEQYRSEFEQYRSLLPSLSASTRDASDAVTMFSSLVGPGPKSVLVLFENNNELRPGGGFIGTYGFLRFNNGQMESQSISSVYDLDGQLPSAGPKLAPPGPFYTATDSWGLRDSNWFADFEQSAKKASAFYEQTGHETPDAVIALTPDVFVDLLKITGPISFPKYKVTLTADNFRDVVQQSTSDETSATPKQMLSDFAPLLMQHVAGLPSSSGGAVLSALIQNLASKNIVLYSSDPVIEAQFEQYNWAGSVAQAPSYGSSSDYLNVVNANIGGEKTDLSVTQSAQLASTVQPDGSIVDTLTYTRTRPQDLTDTAVNKDYVRFLVPRGSTFLGASGFTQQPYRKSDGSAYTWEGANAFTVDPDLAAIDATASVDPATGTVTEQEAGKTEFANWIDVAAGESATVALTYRLPFKVSDSDTYSLTVQAQPGNNPIAFSYTFSPGRPILWYTPDSLDSGGIQSGTVQYSTSLNSDLFIGELFHG